MTKENLMQHLRVFIATILMVSSALAGAADANSSTLTTSMIQKMISAASVKAQALGIPMSIAIVDAGGNLVGYLKMEGAFNHSRYTSEAKAYTAASVRKPTHETGIPPEIADGIATATGGRFTKIPGGFPLILDGKPVGAIGVSGGKGEQDIAVAKAGMEELK
jgi:uncharacterized protein GlcG (DUF336 family)